MVWHDFVLNDGRKIPPIAQGTWLSGDAAVDQVEIALEVGFDHIDTAQSYGNEDGVGLAVKESALSRDDLWITTKWSGRGGKDISTSIQDSLEWLGTSYVDLYLIHSPRLVPEGKTAAFWAEFEALKDEGKARSIGVSNYEIPDLVELFKEAKYKPAVNQVEINPYTWAKRAPLLAFMKEHGIFAEAYSALNSLTRQHGGPVDAPVEKIAKEIGVEPEQVLLAWVRSKGAIIVTSSSKRTRLENYLAVGDLELTPEQVAIIDTAGAKGPPRVLRGVLSPNRLTIPKTRRGKMTALLAIAVVGTVLQTFLWRLVFYLCGA